jgi:hypothetical protein
MRSNAGAPGSFSPSPLPVRLVLLTDFCKAHGLLEWWKLSGQSSQFAAGISQSIPTKLRSDAPSLLPMHAMTMTLPAVSNAWNDYLVTSCSALRKCSETCDGRSGKPPRCVYWLVIYPPPARSFIMNELATDFHLIYENKGFTRDLTNDLSY